MKYFQCLHSFLQEGDTVEPLPPLLSKMMILDEEDEVPTPTSQRGPLGQVRNVFTEFTIQILTSLPCVPHPAEQVVASSTLCSTEGHARLDAVIVLRQRTLESLISV